MKGLYFVFFANLGHLSQTFWVVVADKLNIMHFNILSLTPTKVLNKIWENLDFSTLANIA